MGFVKFMSSMAGRALRVVAGAVMILVGLFAVQGIWVPILVVVGLVMLLAGLMNFCLIAPIFKAPFWGKNL